MDKPQYPQIVVISWKDPDDDEPWVFGPFDHAPTPEEQEAIRQRFMAATTTSELDWDEFGCELHVSNLLPPTRQEES